MLAQRPSDYDQINPANFESKLNCISITELENQYGNSCKHFFTGSYIKLEDLRQSALSGSTAHALSMIGAGRTCYSSLSISQILEMQPELAPAVDFCVKHLNERPLTKKVQLVSAFESEESLKSFAIKSLFATGRLSMDKLIKCIRVKREGAHGTTDNGDEKDGGGDSGDDSDSDSSQAAAGAAGAGADALAAGTAAGPEAEGDERVSIENNGDEVSIAHAEARAPAPAPSVDGSVVEATADGGEGGGSEADESGNAGCKGPSAGDADIGPTTAVVSGLAERTKLAKLAFSANWQTATAVYVTMAISPWMCQRRSLRARRKGRKRPEVWAN